MSDNLKVKKTEAKKTVVRRSEAEKVRLLNTYQKLRNEGKTAQMAADEVGVAYITLRTWQRTREVVAVPDGAAVPVKGSNAKRKKAIATKAVQPSATVVLVMPNGIRAEFASPEDAAAFIKAQS